MVEFVVNDDMVKEVMPARERIIEVLESVGFDAERQALPVASLSGEGLALWGCWLGCGWGWAGVAAWGSRAACGPAAAAAAARCHPC